jgi:hypothetical protein
VDTDSVHGQAFKAAKSTAMKRQHPYARTDDNGPHPKARGDGSNQAPPVPAGIDPNCGRNGRPLAAPTAWRAQARSVRSNNITADALIGALATPHVNSVSPSLNVRGWVNEIATYLQDPHFVRLRGGSMGDVIKQCQSISHQQTGASFVAMVTYMQLAIQCQR